LVTSTLALLTFFSSQSPVLHKDILTKYSNRIPVVLKEPDFWHSALSVSGITYHMTPLISPAYALSNIVSFVMISPGFMFSLVFISALLSISLAIGALILWNICLDLSVCLSVGPQSVLWQMVDWIRVLFVVLSGVGQGMVVLDGGGDRLMGRGSFGVEVWASHCNQWGLCCVVVWKCVNELS